MQRGDVLEASPIALCKAAAPATSDARAALNLRLHRGATAKVAQEAMSLTPQTELSERQARLAT